MKIIVSLNLKIKVLSMVIDILRMESISKQLINLLKTFFKSRVTFQNKYLNIKMICDIWHSLQFADHPLYYLCDNKKVVPRYDFESSCCWAKIKVVPRYKLVSSFCWVKAVPNVKGYGYPPSCSYPEKSLVITNFDWKDHLEKMVLNQNKFR